MAFILAIGSGCGGSYTIAPSAGPNGTLDPSVPQTVKKGGFASFTVTPASGYAIGSVSGCGGTLTGSTYTTGAVTANCTVSAAFVDPGIKAEHAAELKKRTLTNLYNAAPSWLTNAHHTLDEAVSAAYGWEWPLSDDEILRRLFDLNRERSNVG